MQKPRRTPLCHARRPAARVLALVAAAVACAPAGSDEDGRVVARDSNYRVTMQAASPKNAEDAGELRLTVETSEGWHIAPEAPAKLDLASEGPLRFEPSALRQADAQGVHDDGFEFATALRSERPGHALARGELKFGICEDPARKCILVRRSLELPIEVAFDD